MGKDPFISIVMPAYNTGAYIAEAIRSVVDQSHQNWELIIVNDGSTDDTAGIVKSFTDERIRYFEQPNAGVAAARNLGLSKMQGNYFCFLDSDDTFPQKSLTARLSVFQNNPDVTFVDGCVNYVDSATQEIVKTFCPNFRGAPYPELIKLNKDCFFGSTWMVKRDRAKTYQFNETMSHCEDLMFCIDIAPGGQYDYTAETILNYRVAHGSAMQNLKGLENGYFALIKNVVGKKDLSASDKLGFRLGCARFMVFSYWKRGQIGSGIRVAFKYLLR